MAGNATSSSLIGGNTSNHQNSFLTDKFVKKTNRVKDTTNTLTAIDNYIEEKSILGRFKLNFLRGQEKFLIFAF
jgi:hypothetical protein